MRWVVVSVWLIGFAAAQEGRAVRTPFDAAFDKNKDGVLSPQEEREKNAVLGEIERLKRAIGALQKRIQQLRSDKKNPKMRKEMEKISRWLCQLKDAFNKLKREIEERAEEAFREIRKRQVKRLGELQERRKKLLEAARVAEEAGEKEAAGRLRRKAAETARKISSLKNALQQTTKTDKGIETKKRQLQHLCQRKAQFERAIAETAKELNSVQKQMQELARKQKSLQRKLADLRKARQKLQRQIEELQRELRGRQKR